MVVVEEGGLCWQMWWDVCVGLGGWWWSEVKVECAPAASAWLSVCLLEF